MEVDIILEPDLGPAQLVELATAAEKYGIRALWTSNAVAHWDPFLSLGPFGHVFGTDGDEELPLATHRHVQSICQPQVTILAVQQSFALLPFLLIGNDNFVSSHYGQEDDVKIFALKRIHRANAQPLIT